MDEEVRVVPTGVLEKVVFEVGNGFVVGTASSFAGERREGVGVLEAFGQLLQRCSDDLVLLVAAPVADLFRAAERAKRER